MCDAATDLATLTIASPGDAATGGGWYTLGGSGRSNFGFTVRKVPNTTPAQYKGQFVLVNNGKWRLKGTLSSYVKTSASQGGASGTGDLYWWNSTLNGGLGGWALAQSGVTYTISFTDSGQGGKNSNDTFGIHIDYTPTGAQSSLPNTSPQALKGGDVKVT